MQTLKKNQLQSFAIFRNNRSIDKNKTLQVGEIIVNVGTIIIVPVPIKNFRKRQCMFKIGTFTKVQATVPSDEIKPESFVIG